MKRTDTWALRPHSTLKAVTGSAAQWRLSAASCGPERTCRVERAGALVVTGRQHCTRSTPCWWQEGWVTGWQEAAQKRQDTNSGAKNRTTTLLEIHVWWNGADPPPTAKWWSSHTTCAHSPIPHPEELQGTGKWHEIGLACLHHYHSCLLPDALPPWWFWKSHKAREVIRTGSVLHTGHWLQGTKAKSRDLARLAAIEQLHAAGNHLPTLDHSRAARWRMLLSASRERVWHQLRKLRGNICSLLSRCPQGGAGLASSFPNMP